MKKRSVEILQIVGIYIIIGLIGLLSYLALPDYSEIERFLFADVCMTIITFVFSIIKKNSSVYDAYWSVIPFYFVLFWSYLYWTELSAFHLFVFLVISWWSWRLTLNWTRSWSGFHHEDWRYINLANQTKKFYPIVNFLGIHLFPTLMVFGCMWPLFWMFSGDSISIGICIIGILISVTGILLEMRADNLLSKFRNRENPRKGEILSAGLWSVCRHPNYLGEILFWVGVTTVGLAFGAPLYTSSGVVALILMFRFISIPMKEKRMQELRTNFTDYKSRVPLLLPRMYRKS